MKAKKQDMITIHKSLFKDIIFFEKKIGSKSVHSPLIETR